MSIIANWTEASPQQVEAIVEGGAKLETLLYEDPEVVRFDADKAWHAIHYLLTGTSYGGEGPLAQVVFGGSQLTAQDMGYGPARYLTADQVREVSVELASVSRDSLHRRYEPARLEEAAIYPQGMWFDEGEEAFEYVWQWFEQLVAFVRQVAGNGNCLIHHMS